MLANLAPHSIFLASDGAFRSKYAITEKKLRLAILRHQSGNCQTLQSLAILPAFWKGEDTQYNPDWEHILRCTKLMGMRVQGTFRSAEESIFFHLSPNYCKKGRRVGDSFILQANQCFLQTTKSLSVRECPCELELDQLYHPMARMDLAGLRLTSVLPDNFGARLMSTLSKARDHSQ